MATFFMSGTQVKFKNLWKSRVLLKGRGIREVDPVQQFSEVLGPAFMDVLLVFEGG